MHVLDCLGVVSQNAEIVNGVAVYRVTVDFFVIIEDAVSPEGASANDMAVGEDVPANWTLTWALKSIFHPGLGILAYPLSESTT